MPQPRWLDFAWADLGVAEVPGAAGDPRIARYYADVGHSGIAGDDVAWCAAFLGACLERAGVASTRSLMARSYLAWGDAITEERQGAVAVLSRGADPSLGHTGFLIGTTPYAVILLGGNQDNAVTVQAFPRTRLLGLRWPSAPAAGDATDAGFERALAHVLAMEGGYTDDPYDPGGPTNFGITLAVFARDRGIELSAATLPALKAELQAIAPETVRRIYLERYWHPSASSSLPPAVALMHFDAAVNHGVAAAARMLQEAAGADIDGEIGPLTLAAVAAAPAGRTLRLYADIRRRRYRALPHFWRFGRGWLRRVDATLALATEIARAAPPSSPTPRTKESRPMANETSATPAAPESKWWGQSLTIWGVIVTTLSTVLPTVGPLFGLNITAELVTQLGDQIVLVGQAIAGLVGTIMTVYGRVRASATLQRRPLTLTM